MDNYITCGKIGEGSFSVVIKGRCLRCLKCNRNLKLDENNNTTDNTRSQCNQYVAIKCIKPDSSMKHSLDDDDAVKECAAFKEYLLETQLFSKGGKTFQERIPTAQAVMESKEVFSLKLLKSHPNIIELIEVFREPKTSQLCIVTELMDMNLFEYLQSFEGRPLSESVVRTLIWQALSALNHIHTNGFFHRDIKPENMLICENTLLLKLADFGSCRETSSRPPLTEYIATRWYRAPECLLTNGNYSFEMDIWSLGCVMFELLTARPLFPGKDETQQLQCIQKILGPPPFAVYHDHHSIALLSRTFPSKSVTTTCLESLLPNVSYDCIDLLKRMIEYSPRTRITSELALIHPFFDTVKLPEFQKKSCCSNKQHGSGVNSPKPPNLLRQRSLSTEKHLKIQTRRQQSKIELKDWTCKEKNSKTEDLKATTGQNTISTYCDALTSQTTISSNEGDITRDENDSPLLHMNKDSNTLIRVQGGRDNTILFDPIDKDSNTRHSVVESFPQEITKKNAPMTPTMCHTEVLKSQCSILVNNLQATNKGGSDGGSGSSSSYPSKSHNTPSHLLNLIVTVSETVETLPNPKPIIKFRGPLKLLRKFRKR